jgi:hypothetical protein
MSSPVTSSTAPPKTETGSPNAGLALIQELSGSAVRCGGPTTARPNLPARSLPSPDLGHLGPHHRRKLGMAGSEHSAVFCKQMYTSASFSTSASFVTPAGRGPPSSRVLADLQSSPTSPATAVDR